MGQGRILSELLKSPRSKEKALQFINKCAPSLHDSVVARLEHEHQIQTKAVTSFVEDLNPESTVFHTPEKQQNFTTTDLLPSKSITQEVEIDTRKLFQPPIRKKGLNITSGDKCRDYSAERVESVLNRILQKQDVMNKKNQVFHELQERYTPKMQEMSITQRGMALIHKLRAKRKVALQAEFLRHSNDLKQNSDLQLFTAVKDEYFEEIKHSFESLEASTMANHRRALMQSPSPSSSFSSIEEKKERLRMLKIGRAHV